MKLNETIASLKRDRAQLERTLIAVAVIGVSIFLGITARRRAAPIKVQLSELTTASQKVSAFATGFRPLSPADENRWLLTADTVNVAMPSGSRLIVGQIVAREAESIGLRDVRVRFAAPDSQFIPTRGNGPGAPKTADYIVDVDAHGTFTQLLALLNHLPPGVSVVRIGASAFKSETRYHLVLAVYESTNGNQPG